MRFRLMALAAAGAWLATAGAAGAQRLAAVCGGDCNRDCQVTIDEVLTTVNVGLEQAPASSCDWGDVNADDQITIEEILTGVRTALDGCNGPPCHRRTVNIPAPGANDQENILTALIMAEPGDDIVFPEGTYHLTGQLSLDVDDVTIRGQGHDKTILSFQTQTTGAEGLLVMADRFVIENIGLEDSPGDLLKIVGANGLTIRGVRTEWTRGPNTDNGAYGLYPVECENVLIEDSIVIGAADAGFYIGQSHKIVMRRNRAEFNVAGVEIENSTDADVYENTATNNTGGILVFNLPGLRFIGGERTRVFNNQVFENNVPNFAARGTTVAAVPKGTGIMVLANDKVEVFGNTLRDNGTNHILLISFRTAQIVGGLNTNDRNYDKFSEGVFIHDNTYIGGGTQPEQAVADLVGPTVGGLPLPQIMYDGDTDAMKFVNGQILPEHRLCIQEDDVRFFNIDVIRFGANATSNLAFYDCELERLPAVKIRGVDAVAEPTPTVGPQPTPTPTQVASLESKCRVPPGTGINFDPGDAACEFLSSYRFFAGNGSTQQPNAGLVPFDVNTQLFSDYTVKQRFVYVPAGQAASYNASGAFEFPVGSVIVKTFSYPHDQRAPAQGAEILETRLLVRKSNGWVGLPYVWNAEKTEAVLKIVGATLSVSGVQADGTNATFAYTVPNSNQCKECHRENVDSGGVNLLGIKARHLNKNYSYTSGVANQLTHWAQLGILTGAPSDPSAAPRAAVFDDPTTGNIESRARSYLDINCAHCHNQGGAARSTGVYYAITETTPGHLGICKSPTAAGRGTGGFSRVIDPGHPNESILTFRMRSIEPEIAMPELGRRRVHAEAVDVLSQWIATLENCDSN